MITRCKVTIPVYQSFNKLWHVCVHRSMCWLWQLTWSCRIPDVDFTVRDVKKCVGSQRMIDVIDVGTQEGFTMTMKKWCRYYNKPSTSRKRFLNVLSLEFSNSNLDQHVEQPEVVSASQARLRLALKNRLALWGQHAHALMLHLWIISTVLIPSLLFWWQFLLLSCMYFID